MDFDTLLVDVRLLPRPVSLLLLDQLLVLWGLNYIGRLQHQAIAHTVPDVHEVLMMSEKYLIKRNRKFTPTIE